MANDRLPCFFIGFGLGVALGQLIAANFRERTKSDLLQGGEEGRDLATRNSGDLGKQVAEPRPLEMERALEAGMEAYRESAGNHW